MKYGFTTYPTKARGHFFWSAESLKLNGCAGQGNTLEEALNELEINEVEWIKTASEFGFIIPEELKQ